MHREIGVPSRQRMPVLPLLLLVLVAAPPVVAGPSTAPAVTVFRCLDAAGRLVALRDSPCRDGERQETVRMQRPQDPPPRPATVPAPAATTPAVREIRVVAVQPPQPVFECTAPDGSTYTSDSAEGNPRWLPLWTVGFPAVPVPRPPVVRPPVAPPGGGVPPHGPGQRPRPPHAAVVPGGTWVRDPCVRLPQDEVCRRLSDRRFEILRTYHAAMPSGRAELDREQRVIDERLANDCR